MHVVGQVKPCGICSKVRYPIDMCPTLEEEHANVIGEYQNHKPRYDSYSKTYYKGYRDHPNLTYSSNNQETSNIQLGIGHNHLKNLMSVSRGLGGC